MALERQKTFSTNVNNTIDDQLNEFLTNEKVDPAYVQVVINNDAGLKYATITYGEREELKIAYEEQGKSYTEADEVDYCHFKDIKVLPNTDLDEEVNNFIKDKNISILSINRYVTRINIGALIFYVDLAEQKIKLDKKAEEVAKAREELAQKLATEAVADTNLEISDTTNKYADMLTETKDNTEGITVTSGLSQVEGQSTDAKFDTVTTASIDLKDIKTKKRGNRK